MTKFLFKGISHQLTEYARRDDNAVTVQNEEGFSWVKPQTLRQTSTSLHDDTSLSRLIDLLFISVCETESATELKLKGGFPSEIIFRLQKG